VQITDIGLAWKQNRDDDTWVYAFSHTTGAPIVNASLRVLSGDNALLLTQTTDADGVAHFRVPDKARWLLAENGDDIHAIEFSPTNYHDPDEPYYERFLPLWHFHLPTYGSDERRNVLLFTDRPVYQPGETLHFKAIVREQSENELTVPAALAGRIVFFDAKDQKF